MCQSYAIARYLARKFGKTIYIFTLHLASLTRSSAVVERPQATVLCLSKEGADEHASFTFLRLRKATVLALARIVCLRVPIVTAVGY